MRTLEILLSFLTLLSLIISYPKVTLAKNAKGFLSFTILLALILQILIEQPRVQMYPIYLATGFVLFLSFGSKPSSLLTSLGLISLLIGTAATSILPVFKPYKTTGQYQVATNTRYLVDTSRTEIYGDDPTAARELIVQIWYPTTATSGEKAYWLPDAEAFIPPLAEWFELPKPLFDQLRLVKTSSYLNTPIAIENAPYPIILFSHGWRGFKEQNSFQMEELSSHGYIVAAINHTYGATVTVLPQDRIILTKLNALDEYPDGYSQSTEFPHPRNLLVDQWTQDLQFTLDYLTKLNLEDPENKLTNQLNIDKVGVMGHSTGAGAALQFCLVDERCDVIIGLDTWMEPIQEMAYSASYSKPTLMIHSDDWKNSPERENNRALQHTFAERYPQGTIQTTILGTTHQDLTILPVISPLADYLGLSGPLDGDRTLEILNTLSLDFFNLQLYEIPTSLFNGSSPDYPELLYEDAAD